MLPKNPHKSEMRHPNEWRRDTFNNYPEQFEFTSPLFRFGIRKMIGSVKLLNKNSSVAHVFITFELFLASLNV